MRELTVRGRSFLAAGIAAVVRLLREKLPDTRILLLGILHRQPKYPWMAAAVRKTNALLARLADGRRVRFLDFSGRFLGPDGAIRPALMRRDLLHLSAKGYAVWAEAMRGPLAEMMEPAPPQPEPEKPAGGAPSRAAPSAGPEEPAASGRP